MQSITDWDVALFLASWLSLLSTATDMSERIIFKPPHDMLYLRQAHSSALLPLKLSRHCDGSLCISK